MDQHPRKRDLAEALLDETGTTAKLSVTDLIEMIQNVAEANEGNRMSDVACQANQPSIH